MLLLSTPGFPSRMLSKAWGQTWAILGPHGHRCVGAFHTVKQGGQSLLLCSPWPSQAVFIPAVTRQVTKVLVAEESSEEGGHRG